MEQESKPLKLEVGKKYRDSRGVVVIVTSLDHSRKEYQYRAIDTFGDVHYFTQDGKLMISDESWLDIKEEIR